MKANLVAITALASTLALAGPGSAQIGGLGLPPLGLPDRPVGEVLNGVRGAAGQALGQVDAQARRLLDLRALRLDRLIRANPRDLERDPLGAPVVRGEVLALSPSAQALAAAQALGFTVVRTESFGDIGVSLVTLAPPRRGNVIDAVRALRRADPAGRYEFNHIYFEAQAGAARPVASQAPAPSGQGPVVGLIDSGVDASQAAAVVEQRGFAPGGVRPANHGTAVASLIRRAAPGARLYVADVYGAGPRGGSAAALAGAFDWMAKTGAGVVNVSLVGPPNILLQASVEGLTRRGVMVVAAVSNDGPAAPPAYPASYPGVVAVTGVDRRNRVLIEAGRAEHLDFAAPGADILAAKAGGGQAAVRGASFAAPIVAGRLAQHRGRGGLEALARQAQDLGPPGPDKVYGRGLVGADLR